MTSLRIVDGDVVATRAAALVVGVTRDGSLQIVSGALPTSIRKRLVKDLETIGCDGAEGATWRIPAPEGLSADSVIAVGMAGKPDAEQVRRAAGTALRSASGAKSVAVALPCSNEAMLRAVCEGALLGAARPLRVTATKSPEVGTITVATTAPRAARNAVKRDAINDSAGTVLARDLVNTPPGDLPPLGMADAAKLACKGLPVKVTGWNQARLTKGGMGGILAVGQGSANPPCLVHLEYAPAGARAHLAFVGKGITFDSGGLSLKPPKGMETMKSDMGGAAAVMAATVAIARSNLPVRISAFLACAENMPSGTAQRPGDVITIRGGTTVEVLNTDAEGRLVLADALVLACEGQPDAIVDVATLTGAQMIALGPHVAGVMANDEALRERVVLAGRLVGEPIWPMPLPEALANSLKSNVADLKNIGDRNGGMLVAGLFLQSFISDDIPWAHLDIAGPAFNEGAEHGFTPKGGTGFAARTLVEVARGFAQA